MGVLAFNVTGAMACGTRFPERVWRRRFELGETNQIMRVAVVCAAVMHFVRVGEGFWQCAWEAVGLYYLRVDAWTAEIYWCCRYNTNICLTSLILV